MQQDYGIVLLLYTLSSACLALPTKSESYPKLETIETKNIAESTKNQITPKAAENVSFKVDLKEISLPSNNCSKLEELPDNINETSTNFSVTKSNEYSLEDLNDFNEDDFKDVVTEKLHQQSEECKEFENDFLLLENRMPDLTEEEYGEINKEGATPWNFLKGNLQPDKSKPDSMQYLTPIYITIPIVINSQPRLPLSLTVAGQSIALKLPSAEKSAETSNTNSSSPVQENKRKESNSPAIRQTNRHRSNFRQKMYALNNNLENEEHTNLKK